MIYHKGIVLFFTFFRQIVPVKIRCAGFLILGQGKVGP